MCICMGFYSSTRFSVSVASSNGHDVQRECMRAITRTVSLKGVLLLNFSGSKLACICTSWNI